MVSNNNIVRRGLKVKPYNKESFIRKLNQLNIDCARSWQSPTYLVCCGWLHDVPPTLFILPQLQWVANLHLAGPASCRFVQICLNHCKFINSLANEVLSLPMNRIPSKTCISLQSQPSIWHHYLKHLVWGSQFITSKVTMPKLTFSRKFHWKMHYFCAFYHSKLRKKVLWSFRREKYTFFKSAKKLV